MKFEIKFEKRDLWIGLFWDVRNDGIHIFVCPFPCIVLHWVIENDKSMKTATTEVKGILSAKEKLNRRVDRICKKTGTAYEECLRCRMDKAETKTCTTCSDRPEIPKRDPRMRGSMMICGLCVHARVDSSACDPCIFNRGMSEE